MKGRKSELWCCASGRRSERCVHCTVWFLYLHRCRSRGPAVQGATGSGRTWQRRSVATPPFFRPTRYPPSPTLPPAPRLRAARAHARALAHRISVCALSSEAPITPGIHGRRGVPPEARIEAPAPSTRRDPRHHQPLPGNTARVGRTAGSRPSEAMHHSAPQRRGPNSALMQHSAAGGVEASKAGQ